LHSQKYEFATEPVDLVFDGFVIPLWRRIRSVADRLRAIQQGRLHAYLLYLMGALVLLLIYLGVRLNG
jgi:hypothetical protein